MVECLGALYVAPEFSQLLLRESWSVLTRGCQAEDTRMPDQFTVLFDSLTYNTYRTIGGAIQCPFFTQGRLRHWLTNPGPGNHVASTFAATYVCILGAAA